MTRPARSGQAGFTIMELMVVTTIIAIMMGIGIPSFRNFIASQRVKSAATELMSTLLIARSEAIKRNVAPGVTITPDASGWAGGWTAAYTGATVHSQEKLEGITVTTLDSTCASAATVANVTFGTNGRADASRCFKFESNSTNGASRCVKVDLTGIPSSGSCP